MVHPGQVRMTDHARISWVTVALAAGLLLLMFLLGYCSRTTDSADVYEARPASETRIDRRVDTVERIVERRPVRVVVSPPAVAQGPERLIIDTVWISADSARLTEVGVEQAFAARVDTVSGRDTVRGTIDITARAPRGPITLSEMRADLSVFGLPDTVRLPAETVVVTTERIVRVKPTFFERVGWVSGGFLLGATAVGLYVASQSE